MSKVLILLVVGAGALQLSAQSNATGGATAGGGASTGGATGAGGTGGAPSPSRIPTPGTTSPTQNTTPSVAPPPRPIFLSGKVMMEDGLPVPPNVVIQSVCGTSPHAVAYTDSKGRFNFQWGQTNGMFMSAAEASGGFGSNGNSPFGTASSGSGTSRIGGLGDQYGTQLMGCDLQASLAGYRSDVIHLSNHTASDNPDVGMIVLHRLVGVEGASISMTSLLAPKDAKKAFDRAQQSVLKKKDADAVKDFEKAVTVYPKYADAWVALGKLQLQQKSADAARESFLKAMEADPKLVFPQIELGLMSADAKKWEDAAQYLEHATKLDPVDYPNAWYVLAVANYNLKQFDPAEKSAREAVKLDPKHRNPRAGYLLGLILAEKHDYAGAAAELKTYMELVPTAQDMPLVKQQLGKLQSFMANAETPADADSPAGVRE